MLKTLPDFLVGYWMYAAGAVVSLALLAWFSEKMREHIKKALLLFLLLFALGAGYELVTGKSLVSLPTRMDRKLSEQPKNIETGRRYYKSYEERFGEPPPRDN
ncbi:MAG: hypothetical protein Kow0089_04460 [Desulfobulbaceae bacterium]